MSDQAGPYVYVVGDKNVIAQQRVTVGVRENGMAAVTGLDPNAQVVIDGLPNAAPGTAVAPTEKDLTADAVAADAAAGQAP